MKIYRIIVIALLLSGCAKNIDMVAQSYHDTSIGFDLTKDIILSNNSHKIFRGGNNQGSDHLNMLEQGYIMIEYSSFDKNDIALRGANFNESQVLLQANKVYSSVVLLYANMMQPMYLGLQGGLIPVNRNRYLATYYIKTKAPIFGVYILDLSPEVRQKIGSNNGVIVNVVVKDSPVFLADILKGNIIRKIGYIDIVDVKSFQEVFRHYIGQTVNVLILRDGHEINKQIQLNECCISI